MLFRQIYDSLLAQATYLIGCQRTGEAILVDPERDVDRYLHEAARHGLRVVAVTETHIHADFLSGARELAERIDAMLYLSGEGGDDWSYRWLDSRSSGGSYRHRLLHDGDEFSIGGILFRAMHTPGHTPEHMSYLVTDVGGGASEPMGILSGDFVFVGDLGRPDLLETAAGVAAAKEPAARELCASARRAVELPEFMQVWPAHGAGSACGKALGAVPQTTIGYEKRYNPALQLVDDESAFVESILEGQPEPPLYFGRMKVENRDGPALLGDGPSPRRLDEAEIAAIDANEVAIVDTRPWSQFGAAHTPGALYAPFGPNFTAIVGSYVRADEPIVMIIDPDLATLAMRACLRIGLDHLEGIVMPATYQAAVENGLVTTVAAKEIDARTLEARNGDRGCILDVRRQVEYQAGAIPGAMNIAHTRLLDRLDEVPDDCPVVVHCQGGVRSQFATAMLERSGREAINLTGGFMEWLRAGGQVVRPEA